MHSGTSTGTSDGLHYEDHNNDDSAADDDDDDDHDDQGHCWLCKASSHQD